MMTSFLDLLNGVVMKKHFNESYYNVAELSIKLQKSNATEISIDNDCFIVPFYICTEGTYEMYGYEFSIHLVDKPSFDNYVLAKTGSKSMDSVDKSVKDKMESLYVEIIHPNTTLSSVKLQEYIEFINHSDEIKKEVTDAFIKVGKHLKFNENDVFLAVY